MSDQGPPVAAGRAGSITRLLCGARDGDGRAAAELFPLVYAELRTLARGRMGDERAGHTLQATALVHEVYLKLMGPERAAPWSDRRQFFFAAAEAMRQILIDHARARAGLKRGGGRKRVPLGVLDLATDEEQIPEILALDEAVSRLEQVSPDVAAVVRLRFYAGLSVEETAEALGVSPRTVKREWTYARARLFRELGYDKQ
jgi:RNA polymerase sigma factor (TIGR02999 family)